MPEETMVCRDIYVRHTAKDGKSFVAQHRVWDAPRFLASRSAEAAKEGGLARCDQITPDQYLKERK